jgi:hypothetical protein
LRVAALRTGGEPDEWRELGFDVGAGGVTSLGEIRLELEPSAERGSIVSWTLEGEEVPDSIDGLPTHPGRRDAAQTSHPNGVVAIDHVVVFTPSLARTTDALAAIGVECRRVREAGEGVRQGFFLVGDLLLEVIAGTPGLSDADPARFWGITLVVTDIDAAAELLGGRLGRVKDAVQPGRRIATIRPEASGGLPVALITPRA